MTAPHPPGYGGPGGLRKANGRRQIASSWAARPRPRSRHGAAGGTQCVAGGGSRRVPSSTVWKALCYTAESEPIDDRFTPAPMRRVAFSAQPAADRAPPLSGRLRPTPAKCSKHGSPCTPPRLGSVCGGSAGSMLTPNSATSGGERFALRCGSVHATPSRSALRRSQRRGGARFMFRGRNTPRVRPASALCAGRPEHRPRPSQPGAQAARALMPLLRSPCLGPGVRRELCCGTCTCPPRSSGLPRLHHCATVPG